MAPHSETGMELAQAFTMSPVTPAAVAVCYHDAMRTFTAVIERDGTTGQFVGYVPGWPGAYSQGDTLDELRANLEEVIAMLLEDGAPRLEAEFIGTHTVRVA